MGWPSPELVFWVKKSLFACYLARSSEKSFPLSACSSSTCRLSSRGLGTQASLQNHGRLSKVVVPSPSMWARKQWKVSLTTLHMLPPLHLHATLKPATWTSLGKSNVV